MAAPMIRTRCTAVASIFRGLCEKRSSNRVISFFKKKTPEEDKELLEKINPGYTEPVPSPPPKSFSPPNDVAKIVTGIVQECSDDLTIRDNLTKFKILTRCMEKFNYNIPNTELAEMSTVDDIIKFYSIERLAKTTDKELMTADLPKNLHVQLEPIRFTEETKDFFGGQTAFPNHDTIITSLKYKKEYKGYKNPKKYKKKYGFNYG